MIELVVRLVFSLAVVLGMLLLLTRLSAKRFKGGTDALIRVLHRQPLSRTSAVAVVTVGSRVLVVGTTEHQVQLLAELDPEEIELPHPVTAAAASPAAVVIGPAVHADAVLHADSTVQADSVAQVAEEADRWELATLDELLGPPPHNSAPGTDEAGYSPKHAAGASVARRTVATVRPAEGVLAGSLLSAQTWRQAFAAASNRSKGAS